MHGSDHIGEFSNAPSNPKYNKWGKIACHLMNKAHNVLPLRGGKSELVETVEGKSAEANGGKKIHSGAAAVAPADARAAEAPNVVIARAGEAAGALVGVDEVGEGNEAGQGDKVGEGDEVGEGNEADESAHNGAVAMDVLNRDNAK